MCSTIQIRYYCGYFIFGPLSFLPVSINVEIYIYIVNYMERAQTVKEPEFEVIIKQHSSRWFRYEKS